LALAAVVLAWSHPAAAQTVDGFNPGADGYVYAVALQKDGKVLVGGDFFHLNCFPNCGAGAIERNYIARLNADGTVDTAFNPGADGPIYGIVVQPDGQIVIGGNFSMVGGGGTGSTNLRYLARLNTDGSVDASFNPGVNMNNYVAAMALQPDGKLLVGGYFYAGLGGQVRYFFGRLNTDGTADQSFAPGVDGAVSTIALQADGKILLGGVFTHLGGEFGDTPRNFIGRLNADGTVDMTFNPGANFRVDSIAVQSDGKILVGGLFTGLGSGDGSIPRFHIGRLNPNGIVDQDFIPGADDLVYSFAVQADGRIIVGGNFAHLGGGGTGVTPRANIGRLNPDGSIDPTFDPGANGSVRGLALQGDGHLVVGGTFTHIGGIIGTADRRYVGRILNSDPAVQSVTVTDGGATITWLRNGTLPDAAFVDFAMSTNGVTYTPLGDGTRLVGGWRVTGASLPVNPNLTLRMRAHYPTGQDGASGSMIEWIVPAADFNTIENGDFSLGLSGWLFFATPDMTYIVHNVTNGVLNFYRVPPPPGTTNQAVAYQQTGIPLSANVPITAEFDLGNSSSVRKRISILLHDSDFSDLAVCTFWLPANTPLTRYRMTSHTTKAMLNLTISFYAASAGTNGGSYLVDNVSLRYSPGGSITETMCEDPLAPEPSGADSGTMLVNGDFGTGSLLPGWGTFGQINGSVIGGVYEFTKLAGTPAGVLLQATGQAVGAGEVLTATFQLGNSSAERKRVTVLLHDNNFSDLSACTFWLAPGQPLSAYTYRTFATQPWANATISVYPATVGEVPSTRLDNVTLRRTPSAAIVGTECLEPASTVVARSAVRATRKSVPATAPALPGAVRGPALVPGDGTPVIGMDAPWVAVAHEAGVHILHTGTSVDLTSAPWARLSVDSWLRSIKSRAEIQVSEDGVTWTTLHVVEPSENWEAIHLDLSGYVGTTIRIRFVLDGVPAAGGRAPDVWGVREIRIRR
jgi:uncharacterized delta-60 repeat protein